MKTSEQAAREYGSAMGNDPQKPLNATYDGFKKGVEFAQQWIDVKDELPENNSKEQFLCKDAVLNEHFICWFMGGKFRSTYRIPSTQSGNWDGNMFREDLTEIITHWRPINIL